MKIVKLLAPAVVDGAVRQPNECPLTVTDAEAERLKDADVLDGEPEDVPEEEDAPSARAKTAQRGKQEA